MGRKPLWHDKKRVENIPDLDKGHKEEIVKLLEFCDNIVEDSSKNSQYSKNYVIIRLVSLTEGYLKAIITTLVDVFEIKPSKVIGHDVLNIHLDQLEDFETINLTKGKIVALAMTATNERSLHEFFTGINKVKHYFNWFDDLANAEKLERRRGWFNFVKHTLDTRHDVVHNLKDVTETTEKLHKTIEDMYDFASYSLYYSVINLCLIKGMDAGEELEVAAKMLAYIKSEMKINQFKSITDTHLKEKQKKNWKKS